MNRHPAKAACFGATGIFWLILFIGPFYWPGSGLDTIFRLPRAGPIDGPMLQFFL